MARHRLHLARLLAVAVVLAAALLVPSLGPPWSAAAAGDTGGTGDAGGAAGGGAGRAGTGASGATHGSAAASPGPSSALAPLARWATAVVPARPEIRAGGMAAPRSEPSGVGLADLLAAGALAGLAAARRCAARGATGPGSPGTDLPAPSLRAPPAALVR